MLLGHTKEGGELTTEAFREKFWVTSHVIKSMNAAILADADENGTRSWEVII